MTQTISSLTWQDTTDATAPIASYNIEFNTDPNWQIGLLGSYHDIAIQPAGLTVDNSTGVQAVTVQIGTDQTVVPPSQRLNVPVARNALVVFLSSAEPATVPITFFLANPAPESSFSPLAQNAVITNNLDISGTNTSQLIAAGLNGVVLGFEVTILNGSQASGGATLALIDGDTTQVWLGNVSLDGKAGNVAPMGMNDINVPFIKGLSFTCLSTSVDHSFATCTVYYRTVS